MATPPKKALKTVKAAKKAALSAANQIEMELVQFKTDTRAIPINIDVTGDTVWATQQQMADLYEIDRTVVTKHIANIFDDGELDRDSVSAKFAHTASDGKTYDTLHYDLDMILAVGFRAKSPKAAEFRKWASSTLHSYIIDGYALNRARLDADPLALNRLASALRAIRAKEKNVYAQVREFFKEASTDYDSSSQQCRSFYALLQDKLLRHHHHDCLSNHPRSRRPQRAEHGRPVVRR